MSKKRLLKKLKTELRKAIPALFDQLSAEHSDLRCFGLGTTAIIEAIVPIYQCESQIFDDDEQKYSPWEWEMGDGAIDLGEEVPRVRGEIKQIFDDTDDYDLANDYRDCIIEVLVDLKKSNAFGKPKSRPFLAFWQIGDDEEWVIKSSKALNTPSTHAAALEYWE